MRRSDLQWESKWQLPHDAPHHSLCGNITVDCGLYSVNPLTILSEYQGIDDVLRKITTLKQVRVVTLKLQNNSNQVLYFLFRREW